MQGECFKSHLFIQPYLYTESNKIFLKQVELLKLSEFFIFYINILLIFLSMINSSYYYYSILRYTSK